MDALFKYGLSKEHEWFKTYGFTAREIDVLSCLLEQHSSKKIASILDIKQKTVESHIFNIMQKLDKHSRISVVDLLKKSSVIGYLQERKQILITNYEFIEVLKKIKQKVPCKNITCKIECQDESIKQKIESDLKSLNILCFQRKKDIKVIDVDIHESYQVTFFEVLRKLLQHPIVEKGLVQFKYGNSESHTVTNVVTHIVNEKSQNGDGFLLKLILLFFISVGVSVGCIYIKNYFSTPVIRSDFDISISDKILKRTKILDKINTLFKNNEPIKVVGLVGISGAGKSVLAQQYAASQKAIITWEFNAKNKSMLSQSFSDLAYVLCKTNEDKHELEAIRQIKNREEYQSRLIFFTKKRIKIHKSNWFFLYDNVSNLKDIEIFLPTDETTWGKGQLLFTTKNDRISSHSFIKRLNLIRISELTESEKVELFFKVLEKRDEDTKSLIEFLNKLPPYPLDIYIAAYYIKNTNNTYAEYLELLSSRQNKNEYLSNIGYEGKTRYQIISNSIEKIVGKKSEFIKPLFLISTLDGKNISVNFLKQLIDPHCIDVFVQKMLQFSLLSFKKDKTTRETYLIIHQSTQAAINQYLEKNLDEKDYIDGMSFVTDALYKQVDDIIMSYDISKMRSCINHSKNLLDQEKTLPNCQSKIEAQLGKLYFCMGEINNSKLFLEKSIKNLSELNKKNITLFEASVLMYLGAALDDLGDHEKSLSCLKKSIHFYENIAPKLLDNLALAYLFIGKTYSQMRDFNLSKQSLEKSIKLYNQTYHKNEKNIYIARTLLAETYMYGGDYKNAEFWFEKNESAYLKNNDHGVERLWNKLRLGRLYLFTGQYQKARDILEKGVADLKKQPMVSTYKIGWNQTYLGDAYRLLGLYELSETCLMNSLEQYKNYYGDHHIMVAWIKGYLGRLYFDLGDFDKAIKELTFSLEIHQKVYGLNKKRYVPIIHALAKSYAYLGKYELSDEYFTQTLQIYEEMYGMKHILYNLAKLDYGHFCAKRGDISKAQNIFNDVSKVLDQDQHKEYYKLHEYQGDLYLIKSKKSQHNHDRQKWIKESNNCYKKALLCIKNDYSKNSAHGIRIRKKLIKK